MSMFKSRRDKKRRKEERHRMRHRRKYPNYYYSMYYAPIPEMEFDAYVEKWRNYAAMSFR